MLPVNVSVRLMAPTSSCCFHYLTLFYVFIIQIDIGKLLMWHVICYRQESKNSLIKKINKLCMAAEELNSSFEEILTCLESSEVCYKSAHSSDLTVF